MGNYRVTINAVGGHGQHRHLGNGETVTAWPDDSPEAIIAKAIEELKAHGNSVTEATIHHWPGTGTEIIDNLLTGKRVGSF